MSDDSCIIISSDEEAGIKPQVECVIFTPKNTQSCLQTVAGNLLNPHSVPVWNTCLLILLHIRSGEELDEINDVRYRKR